MDSRKVRRLSIYREPEDKESETIFRADADKKRVTFTKYCRGYGIICEADERRIRRHSARVKDVDG